MGVGEGGALLFKRVAHCRFCGDVLTGKGEETRQGTKACADMNDFFVNRSVFSGFIYIIVYNEKLSATSRFFKRDPGAACGEQLPPQLLALNCPG